jgi:NAD(P)-dependent dehydrogenase (short-subunit alcohol dehydrogenase family)
MKTFLVTGSTQGLGLAIVKQLALKKDTMIIMAVRNLAKGKEIAKSLGENVQAVELDLSSLKNIELFIKNWKKKLDGLINNAGVQHSSKNSFTPDGFEETIAVNHLASFLLTIGLAKHLVGGRVLFIGSGTHDPKHPHAKFFGFRGAQYTSIKELSEGLGKNTEIAQLNLDRYATSKFLNTVTAVELSRRQKDFLSVVLDPGLMPGTGLARTQNGFMLFLWKWLMPIVGIFLPDTSSTRKSGNAASWIISDEKFDYPSGTIFSYNKKPGKHVWKEMVYNERIGKEIYEDSLLMLKKYM